MTEESGHSEQDNYSPSLDDLIPLSKAANLTGVSASHLRLLVRRGEVWGKKIGRNWLTTKEAVIKYLAQDIKPGPKPEKGKSEDEN